MAVDAVSNNQSSTTSLGVEKKDQLGQKQFMQLMIAQLQNQDPTQPADPSAFLSQLAQFGTVSGIQSMQDSLSTLSDSLRSSQVLGGTNMVGHYVLADSSAATLDATGEVAGATTIPKGATEASVVITDASGQLVRQMPISAQEGESDFLWDGNTNLGTRAPAGNYKVQTFAKVGGASEELTTQLVGHVGSVTIDPNNNSLTLNTDLGPISLSRVRRVM
ncbi:MAG TPA: flagellar hook capping FlgD N-terminal domain-containing protein [Steroidobacteraceae bacterium]|nr:flagellar hook capping FlgD N-terminal domain-containing protein [Steroidobacteraceae bacterium]